MALNETVMRKRPELTIGIVPTPAFTLLALAGFVDALRLAADEGDRSRPLRCAWTLLSENRAPVRASNGVTVQTGEGFGDPARFDYLVVVGGLLDSVAQAGAGAALIAFLHAAAAANVRLIGLCTGSFTLAEAGLLEGRRACVSWFHHDEFAARFPRVPVVSDRLFIEERGRITCAGGSSVIHLASHLIERHLGPGSAAKGLRIMIEDTQRLGEAPQPAPRLLENAVDPRVRRALLHIERRLAERIDVTELADVVGISARQLTRLFHRDLGLTPAGALVNMRLGRAGALLPERAMTLARIAAECGFSDAAHLCRRWKAATGASPRARDASAHPA